MVEALVTDEALAEQIGELPESANPERISEWTATREGLARIEDNISALISVVIATAHGNPPQVKAARRPDTALKTIRNRVRLRQHQALVKKLVRR